MEILHGITDKCPSESLKAQLHQIPSDQAKAHPEQFARELRNELGVIMLPVAPVSLLSALPIYLQGFGVPCVKVGWPATLPYDTVTVPEVTYDRKLAAHMVTRVPQVNVAFGSTLLMFMRTGLGRLYQSVSPDNGETWSVPAPTDLAADHSLAALAVIPDTGHLICVWNQHNEQEIRPGKVRTRISSAVSRSGGFVWEFFQNVESIYPETRVPPGPIRPCRPEEAYRRSLHESRTWDPEHVRTLPPGFGRWSYPSLHISGDRALIAHTYSVFDDDGQLVSGSRLKVLPLAWFYGGRDRFINNDQVDKLVEAARP